MAVGSTWCSLKGRIKALPKTGMSTEPHVSAAQWTNPEQKSATRTPATMKQNMNPIRTPSESFSLSKSDTAWENLIFSRLKFFQLTLAWTWGARPVAQRWDHSPPTNVPWFKSRRRRHMWVEFVDGSLPCSKRIFLGTPVFPYPQKPTFPISNSTRNQVDKEPLCGCANCKSLFIYLFIIYF